MRPRMNRSHATSRNKRAPRKDLRLCVSLLLGRRSLPPVLGRVRYAIDRHQGVSDPGVGFASPFHAPFGVAHALVSAVGSASAQAMDHVEDLRNGCREFCTESGRDSPSHHAPHGGAVLGAVNASVLRTDRADRYAASGIDRACAQREVLAFT